MSLLDEFREHQRNNPLKGEMNGECNRRACNKKYAIHYNRITLKWYCTTCARELNKNETPGGPLCDWPTADMIVDSKRVKL